ncbi:MAG: hypothetical protein EBX52_02990 [Proteobacteria bacterium]|nr:hypothetical protein [Pseudomonadota bacterium]
MTLCEVESRIGVSGSSEAGADGQRMGFRISLRFLVMATAGVFSAWTVFAADGVGKAVSVTGKVMSRVEGADKGRKGVPATRFLKTGDEIYRSDVINTGSDSSVKILFSDESIMDLGPSTLFKVEEFQNTKGKPEARKVEMSLAYGRIRAAINQKVGKEGKFKIRTHAATMGVRGTEFYVNAGSADSLKAGVESKSDSKPPVTELVVTEGKVEAVKSAGTAKETKAVAVNPGEKFTAVVEPVKSESGGAPAPKAPQVEKISVAEMKAVVTTTKIVDQTFAQAIKIDLPPQGDSPKGGASGTGAVLQGAETLAVIKDSILSKPELKNPLVGPSNFAVPGVPGIQPNFAGNFLPGFNAKYVKIHVQIHGPGPQ